MAVFKCKMCGGTLEINAGGTVAICEYCGTRQTTPNGDDEKKANLFNRANRLRMENEFDKAAGVYESIVSEFPEEAEGYWGLVLCKYGVEYVDDAKTLKKIPTCHRTVASSVLEDDNYIKAYENAYGIAQTVYQEEAKAIDELQQKIIAVAESVEPYDIFICYKETDDITKSRTEDSLLAQDIYTELVKDGYKVFFSRVTLRDKAGTEYEPYIYAALKSAKVMLAIGTKFDYYDAAWVKNEWGRFLSMMEEDASKHLIPCFKNMDAYDIPKAFRNLQALDMGEVAFFKNLINNVQRFVPKAKAEQNNHGENTEDSAHGMVESLLKRVFIFLGDRDWEKADEYCEKVLDIAPENATAYLGKLMAELHVSRKEFLKLCNEPFNGRNNYSKIVRYGDAALKKELGEYITHIQERNKKLRIEEIYANAKSVMDSATCEEDFQKASEAFAKIPEYADAKELAEKCDTLAKTARKDTILRGAIQTMSRDFDTRYDDAIKLLKSIPGWKNADELLLECEKKAKELRAQREAQRLEEKRIADIQQEQRLKKQRVDARNSMVKRVLAIIVAVAVLASVVGVLVWKNVIIPNREYDKAIALMENGSATEAYHALLALKGYRDSTEKANSIYKEYFLEKNTKLDVGDYIKFGTYEQDNNQSNGSEEIEWLILDKKGNKLLVISKYALQHDVFSKQNKDIAWETSYPREWLNKVLLTGSFTDAEEKMILTTTVEPHQNPQYDTSSGAATQDKIFLLSITEANEYFKTDEERICEVTPFVAKKGAYINSDYGDNGRACAWWLRTSGASATNNANVLFAGSVNAHGPHVNFDSCGIRPAMWIDIG